MIPQYVQSNPSWSPDGRYVVFARAKAYELRSKEAENKLLLSEEECAEFLREGKPFLFDLYRIPYNDGQGREGGAACRARRATGAAIISPSIRRTAGGSSFARHGVTCCCSRTASFTSSRPGVARPAGCNATPRA